MRIALLSTLCVVLLSSASIAAEGDTIHVRTIEFGGANEGAFKFPSAATRYHKVLMNFTARCPQNKPCGEWDYLQYIYLDEHRKNPDTIVRHELMRFITPYGNGLSLGTGFTWTMDVTDFTPLLHDSVHIVNGGATQQEEVQITFDIIEGVPPRDVISIIPLWFGNPQFGQVPDIDTSFYTPRTVPVPANAKGAKLRVTQSGHGFGGDTENCSEFCDKIQYIKVSDTVHYQRHVWRSTCGLNPVYPQGGTWVYSRSNWCPGAEVTPFDYEITPWITAGQPVRVDVDMQPYTFVRTDAGTAPNYVVSSDLFFYGAPNFTNDASIEKILAPTTEGFYKRHNPICANPVVCIRNTGANALRSLTIQYGVRGGGTATYQWSGNLAFMDSVLVPLPPFDWGTWSGPNIFEVTISNPNGVPDEYAVNNHLAAAFDVPGLFYGDIEIRVRTNSQAAAQYSYALTKSDGTVLASRNSMDDNTNYVDSLRLDDGCYTLQFLNAWGYGLSWWATSGQLGTGSLNLTSRGVTVRSFNGDFGQEVYYQFRVGPKPTALNNVDTLFFGTVPVGASASRTVKIYAANTTGLVVSGQTIFVGTQRGYIIESTIPAPDSAGKVTLNGGDSLMITVKFAPTSDGVKNTVLNIRTNDERRPAISIPLIGSAGGSGVDETSVPGARLFLRAVPNVVTGESEITFDCDNLRTDARVTVVDALGRVVNTLYSGSVGNGARSVTFAPNELPNGLYYIILSAHGDSASVGVRVVR
jgi:hypothetical protein